MTTSKIEKHIELLASSQKVWNSLTNETEKWWAPGVFLESVVGGKFVEPWKDASGSHIATGRVVNCIPGSSITFTWHEDSWPVDKETQVSIEINSSQEKSILTVVHSGWSCFSETERNNKIDSFSVGWDHVLSELKKYTEKI